MFSKFRSSRSGSGRNHTAFTLVELLFTFAVISILIALIIGGVGSARQKGKESQCLSNIRQLGVGAMLYAADHDGRLPPHAIYDPEFNVNREWCYGYGFQDPETAFKQGILGPYLSDAQKILEDPTFDYEGDPMEMVGSMGARPTTFGFGYNGFFLSRKITTYGDWEGYPIASIERPAETVMFATSGQLQGKKVRPYENVWPKTRMAMRVIRAVEGTNAYVCWVSGNVSKVPMFMVQNYDGTRLGHIEGYKQANLFDRFDGDKGDKNP